MTCLLDVNVLIALLDRAHVHHGRAHAWFDREGRTSFATCPVTQNAALRILSHPRYPKPAGSPSAVVPVLQSVLALDGHRFWPDEISLLDEARVDPARLLHHARLTDDYLLALAVSRGGRLATMDRRLRPDAVRGGADALLPIG